MRVKLAAFALLAGCLDYNALSRGDVDAGTVPPSDLSPIDDATPGADITVLPPVQVDLSPLFNVAGIYFDGSTFSANGGIDGAGNAYSSNLLATGSTWMGTPITGYANMPDTVQAKGQLVGLPNGKFTQLRVLAVSVNGAPAANFVVTYRDGTTGTFTQGISDFLTPQGFEGELQALTMPYFLRFDGSKDNRTFRVYGYVFALDSTKAVASVTLPNSPNVRVFAMSLGQ